MNLLIDRLIQSQALVKLLIAPPGSGKSTMVPKHLLQAGLRFIMVEPRRAAAQGIFEYLNHPNLGCHVRYYRSANQELFGELITPGILIQYLYHGFPFPVDLIVLDEVHERSRDLDFAMALCRQKNLPMILLSATVDPQDFKSYQPNVFEHKGQTFAVHTEYESEMAVPTEKNLGIRVLNILKNRQFQSALVFVPGKSEMTQVMEAVRSIKPVYAVHGGMSLAEQSLALYSSEQRILVSTNVCESSLTPSGIDLVVDSGLCRILTLSKGREVLTLSPITEESAKQRQGRTGRVAPGVCVRMWGKKIRLEEKWLPEILRTSLDDIVYRSKEMGVEPQKLPWLSPPSRAQWETLDSFGQTKEGNQASLKFLPVPVGLIPGLKRLVELNHPGLDCILFSLALMEGQRNWESKFLIEPTVTVPRLDWMVYLMDAEERIRILGKDGWEKVLRAYTDLQMRLGCFKRTEKVGDRDDAVLLIAKETPRYLFYSKKRQGLFGNDFSQEVELAEIYSRPGVAAVLILDMVAIKDGSGKTWITGNQIWTIPQQLGASLPPTRSAAFEFLIQGDTLWAKKQFFFGSRLLQEKMEIVRGTELLDVLTQRPQLLDNCWPWFGELFYYCRIRTPDFSLILVLKRLGIEEFSDLLLVNPEDVFGTDLLSELNSLRGLYPRELKEPGGTYQMHYDLQNNLVIFESNHHNRAPSQLLQSRFARQRRKFIHKGKIQEI